MPFRRIICLEFLNFSLQVLDDPSTTPRTAHAVKLVSATHALSNYSLSLTPGSPITPAQIRMQKNPALLVIKVIETNPSVYRESDRMLKILSDLIDGTEHLQINPDRELEILRMQTRVNAAIVNAALSENDFTTAYDTCINKLSLATTTYPHDKTISEAAWIAHYRTGIFAGRPTNRHSRHGMPSGTVHDFQKMELLARAMLICPKAEIEGILSHWTILENKQLHPENINAQPPPASTASEHRGLLATAGQIGRGIARTASPLLDGRGNAESNREGTSGEYSRGTSGSRFGVRDTVRTGLTQGIGWLLGAPPQTEGQAYHGPSDTQY
jgi:protein transport protein SEC39